MNLKDKINSDLKDALRSKDKLRLETIRSIRAKILEFEKSGKEMELTPEKEIEMLSSLAKRRKESIEQFEKGGRAELAEKEKKELEIIQDYLPKQLTKAEISEIIKEMSIKIGASSPQDFPKLMPQAVKELKGRAEGGVIREIVQKILGVS